MSDEKHRRLAIVCPSCDRPTASQVLTKYEVGPESGPDVRWPFATRFSLLACQHCGDVALVMQEDYGRGFASDDLYRLWPPQDRQLSDQIPSGLRANHSEARICFKAKAYRASAVMVRRTLEGVCADRGIAESDLYKSLKKLEADRVIDSRLLSWAQGLRQLGNAGAHYDDREIHRQDAEDALEFCEALLDYVYVLSAKFAQFEARRTAAGS